MGHVKGLYQSKDKFAPDLQLSKPRYQAGLSFLDFLLRPMVTLSACRCEGRRFASFGGPVASHFVPNDEHLWILG
jgi:hypothetical protein